ncbi:hypothetical protein [Modestobacter excelsi]|uniref:hypothetical protein n=1 Tax=Modestobacter excelsi TaxID=2213161 RepID=UPI00110D05F3|nr:hypothetical protein [Modestobacter excelsi]
MRNHLTGVFVGSHAIAEGVITRRQLRERSYRRLVHGVYADPGLEFDHRLRCSAVALLLPAGTTIAGHSAAAWHGAPFAATHDPVTVVRPPSVLWRGPREVRVHQIVRDEARIARLEAAGWRVVRLSAADLRDLEGVVVPPWT